MYLCALWVISLTHRGGSANIAKQMHTFCRFGTSKHTSPSDSSETVWACWYFKAWALLAVPKNCSINFANASEMHEENVYLSPSRARGVRARTWSKNTAWGESTQGDSHVPSRCKKCSVTVLPDHQDLVKITKDKQYSPSSQALLSWEISSMLLPSRGLSQLQLSFSGFLQAQCLNPVSPVSQRPKPFTEDRTIT